MEDRRLTADAVRADVGAGVDGGAAVEQEPGGVEEAVFGGDVKQGRALQGEQAAAE